MSLSLAIYFIPQLDYLSLIQNLMGLLAYLILSFSSGGGREEGS